LEIGGQKYLNSLEKAFQKLTIYDKLNSYIFLQATASEAQKLCEKRNMNLASFEKPKENDMVTDFIGALGNTIKKNFEQV